MTFDRHALLALVQKLGGTFIANVDDVHAQFQTDQNVFLRNAIFNSTLVRADGLAADATIDQLSGQRLDTVSGFKTEAQPWYSDQVLPFDITLAGTNENGAATCMKIFGVEILNEGSGICPSRRRGHRDAGDLRRQLRRAHGQVIKKACCLWL